jgi:hypothetical protein
MRKALWLPAVAVMLSPLAAEAQGTGAAWSWGLMGGINLSNLNSESEDDIEMRMGYDIGLTAQKKINATWSFNTGAHWTTKGAKGTDSGTEFEIKLNYIEVPLLFRWTSESGDMKPFIEVGGAAGFNMGCEIEGSGGGVTVTADCDEDPDSEVKTLDMGLVGGAGLEFMGMGRPWTLGVRYNWGVTKINDSSDAPKNSNIQFLLGFRFR